MLENKEKKLNLLILEKTKMLGLDKVTLTLANNNQLILNSCEIDEDLFVKILFKNYVCYINEYKSVTIEIDYKKELDTIKAFNKCVENNDFEKAFEIYNYNYTIHVLLCNTYINNLYLNSLYNSNNSFEDKNLTNVNEKISLIENYSFIQEKKNNTKVLQRVSTR